MMWMWLLACMPKEGEVLGDLMDLEAHEEACGLAPDDPDVAAATWATAHGRLRARRLSDEELGGTADGWQVWDVDLSATSAAIPTMQADIELLDDDGTAWSLCPDCGPDWVTAQLQPRDVLEAIVYEHHRHRNVFGELLMGFVKVIAFPITLVIDIAILPIAALAGEEKLVFPTTRWLVGAGTYRSVPLEPERVASPVRGRAFTELRVFHAWEADEPTTARVTLWGAHLSGCPLPPRTVTAPVRQGTLEVTW